MSDADPTDAALAARLRGLPDPAFKRWLKEALLAMIPETRALGPAARIGLIADTHGRQDDGSDLPDQVLQAFAGVDLIVHCGDIGNLGVLNRLETVAPVLAVPGEIDLGLVDARVGKSPRVVEAGGVRLGIVFDFAQLGTVEEFPDRPVDVIACAASHRDMIASQKGVLLVNPGSPTLPAAPKEGELGTVAVLELRDGIATVEIVRLRRDG